MLFNSLTRIEGIKAPATFNVLQGVSSSNIIVTGNSLYINVPSRANDGVGLVDPVALSAFIATYTSGSYYNDGAGAIVTFPQSHAIRAFEISGYTSGGSVSFKYLIAAYVGGSWVTVSHTLANAPLVNGYQRYEFNEDESIVSNQWRFYITNHTGISNYYAGEIRFLK